MISLAISVLWLLIALVILVGVGWVCVWVLGQLGIILPPLVVKLALIILGLLCLIYALSLVAGGGIALPAMGTGHPLLR